jgi:hypothetical protein
MIRIAVRSRPIGLSWRNGLSLFFMLTAIDPVVWGQPAVTPVPQEARQALALNVGGNSLLLGVGYQYQLIQFGTKHHSHAGALEINAGLGFVPSICILGCSDSGITTHHGLLLLWGRKLQGEIGYAGLLARKGLLYDQAYLPGALAGLRFAPNDWFLRLYIVGLFYHQEGTGITATGELAWQKTRYLQPLPAMSIGFRF